ncbi:MAG: class I SAM-dependent methyltransferase [Bryobacterales bacterium]|nr:class I SAM-dependent methyltransferase [Bryobacterales bacterium]
MVAAALPYRANSPRPGGWPLLLACLGFFAISASAQPIAAGRARSLAPYVPSPQNVVELMLISSGLKPGETLYDLGSGDGRIVITAARKYGARAVGVEISERLVRAANENIQRAGMEARVRIVQGHLLDVDLSEADVVTLYLLTSSNDQLRPNLEKYLKPGARVVSHDFQIRGWKPVKVERALAHNREHTIYVYRMPPR